ncbi:MAG TPA: UvrD-helicase domain-containing protein [Verrucomicrobiae bacterium]|nr:UvrD-helicase domain-containing protein [Verrucomicrobiae bacterium]
MLNLSTLNPQQRQAVETVRGPVLILAGAGTGKTRVITFRIAHLIRRGVAPGHILGVTFTNKAAREMKERVARLVPKPAESREPRVEGKNSRFSPLDSQPTICTFHSLCVRILRRHIEKLGYKRNFVIYDESEQLGAVKKILGSISSKGEKADPAAVLALLSKFKNGGERATAFADDSVRALAEHIRKRYESALHACNAVDFDDLILLTLRLFREHPDALAACRERYRYVMVDEYQDTNAAQFQLVLALTQEHRNLCVVGDDDQSIYGWRGAEIANLLDLEKFFPEVKVIKLEQNYRSTTTILNTANAIIKNNVRRRGKTLWSGKGIGAKIRLQTHANDEDEAREIVAQIEFKRLAQRVPWRDCAILFRTNQQSRPLETALRSAGVRYHLIGGQSFFDRREVRDFLAYLKVFLNPHDDISLLRIANVPARGLSDVTMERLLGASHEQKSSVFTAMKNPLVTAGFQGNARKSIEAFVEFTERTRNELNARPHPDPLPRGEGTAKATPRNTGPWPPRRPADDNSPSPEGEGRGGCKSLQTWAGRFLEEIGYFAELKRQEKDPENAEGRLRNLKELMATMDALTPSLSHPMEEGGRRPAEGAFDRLQTFLEEITLDTEREEEEENQGDAVTLITMHSCKGLEFRHVFIVGLEDGLLPHSRSKAEGTLDEERRLFYVAVTRAMETLTLSHCGGRKKYGQLLPCHPSPFLKELPEEYVEHADDKSKLPVSAETGKDFFTAMRQAIG